MKKVFFFTFFLFSSFFYAKAQISKRLSYRTFLSVGVTSNNIRSSVENPPVAFPVMDTNGRVHFFTNEQLYNQKTTKRNVSKISSIFSGGAIVNFRLTNDFFLKSGIGLSAFRVVRNTSINSSSKFTIVDTINNKSILEGGYVIPPFFVVSGVGTQVPRFYPGVYENYSSYEMQQAYSFVSIDLPIGLQYRYKKFKFEQGVEISFILNTKNVAKNPFTDPEFNGPPSQFENKVKSFFSYCGGVDYSITKKVDLGVIYKIGLTDALQSSDLNSLKVNSFGLRVSYNFK
jgi:hypothetical protein